CEQHNTYPRTF
nr:immunoglobulin light chain junction region [Macaca mulatta]